MKSPITKQFRRAFDDLSEDVRFRSRQAYRIFRDDPYHPSLHFKAVHPTRPIYSVGIGLTYRALGILNGDQIVWFWIGPHVEYDRLLASL